MALELARHIKVMLFTIEFLFSKGIVVGHLGAIFDGNRQDLVRCPCCGATPY